MRVLKLERDSFRLALGAGEVLRLDSAGGVEVVVESGRLWITEERQLRDLWLRDGERLRLEGRGLTLLEADRPTKLHILGA